jgi:hypothetical protein
MDSQSDRELLQLARMATEADELESGEAEVVPLRFPGASPGHVRAFKLAGGLIAAAAALATSVVMLVPRETRQDAPMVAQGEPETSVLPVDDEQLTPPEKCMLLAVYRTPDGSCDCVQIHPHEWEGGKKLAEVTRNELVDAALKSPCTNDADRVVVMAVSAPADVIGKSAEAAERVASRIASAPPTWHEDISAYATAAMPDLPKGATVVAKSLAMSR